MANLKLMDYKTGMVVIKMQVRWACSRSRALADSQLPQMAAVAYLGYSRKLVTVKTKRHNS